MRIAVMSDIHGNDIALLSVLDDINKSNVDEIICLGDIVTIGINPKKVIDILKNIKCSFIMGNHDEFIINCDVSSSYKSMELIIESINWARQKLSPEDIDFMNSFQRTIKRSFSCEALFFHGSPKSHTDDILSTTSSDKIDDYLAGYDSSIFCCGHTHIQMLRQHKGKFIVNPGSVGFPFKEYAMGAKPVVLKHSEYMIIDITNKSISFDLKRISFDLNELLRDIEKSDSPTREMLISQYSD